MARAIARVLGEWERPHVELAIFQSDDPRQIAHALDALCQRELGAAIARPRFYEASIGAVAGVELDATTGLTVRAGDYGTFTRTLPKVAQAHQIRVQRLVPADESLESVFSYLVGA